MRRALLGVSAFALSGCAWFGGAPEYHHGNTYQSGYHGHHSHHGHHVGHQVTTPSRWSVEGSIAAQQFTGGNVLQNFPTAGDSTFKQEYDDVYETGLGATAGLSYDVAPKTTIFGQGFYNEAESKNERLNIGSTAGGTPLFGTISDYKSYGMEVGFREYASANPYKTRPYIGGTIGMSYVDSIDARIDGVGPAPVEPPAVRRLYDGEWVPTASGIIGVEMPIARQAALALETGLKFEGKRDPVLLDGRTSVEPTYTVPVRLRGRYRF